MLKLENKTIARLRDRLKERGERPSLFATDVAALGATPDAVPPDILVRFDALCEAMYLMAAADGKLDPSEEDTLRGAIRELSDGVVRSAQVRSMIEGAQARLAQHGLDARIVAVAESLADDHASAEAAFVLAAAIAFADDEIADEENDVLNKLADALGIEAEDAERLLDEMHVGVSAASPS